jgi:ATP dependent DNA ligase domain
VSNGFQRRKPPAIGGKAPYPGFIEPALATSIDKVPNGERWIHKIKFDRYRMQLHLVHEAVTVYTRRGNDWTKRFKKVADGACHIGAGSAIIEGEIVVPAADVAPQTKRPEGVSGGGRLHRIEGWGRWQGAFPSLGSLNSTRVCLNFKTRVSEPQSTGFSFPAQSSHGIDQVDRDEGHNYANDDEGDGTFHLANIPFTVRRCDASLDNPIQP